MMYEKNLAIADLEAVYDAISDACDEAGPEKTNLFLAKLALTYSNIIGDRETCLNAIEASLKDL